MKFPHKYESFFVKDVNLINEKSVPYFAPTSVSLRSLYKKSGGEFLLDCLPSVSRGKSTAASRINP